MDAMRRHPITTATGTSEVITIPTGFVILMRRLLE